jgi:hypothetical protein
MRHRLFCQDPFHASSLSTPIECLVAFDDATSRLGLMPSFVFFVALKKNALGKS